MAAPPYPAYEIGAAETGNKKAPSVAGRGFALMSERGALKRVLGHPLDQLHLFAVQQLLNIHQNQSSMALRYLVRIFVAFSISSSVMPFLSRICLKIVPKLSKAVPPLCG